MDERKKCGRCEIEKDAAEFYVIKGKLSSYCRVCQLAQMKEWRQKHLELERERDRAYYEKTKSVQSEKKKREWAETPAAEKARQLAKLAEWGRLHPERAAIRSAKWALEHPEEMRAKSRRYFATEKGKAKRREVMRKRRVQMGAHYQIKEAGRAGRRKYGLLPEKITGQQWEAIVAAWGGSCAYCGATDVKLTVDHFVPLKRGGVHALHNIVPACLPCNNMKRAGDPFVFLAEAA